MSTTPTAKQLDILRHTLGVGRGPAGWRNYFITGPGTDDHPHCEAMVAAGWMTKREGTALSGWDDVYSVTEAGRDAMRGAKASAAQINTETAARSA